MLNYLKKSDFLIYKECRLYNSISSRIKSLCFQKKIHDDMSLKYFEAYSLNSDVPLERDFNSEIKKLEKLRARLDCYSFISHSIVDYRLNWNIDDIQELNNYENYSLEYFDVYQTWKTEFPDTLQEHVEKVLPFYVPRRNTLKDRLHCLQKELLQSRRVSNIERVKKLESDVMKEKFRVSCVEVFMSKIKQSSLEARKSELLSRLYIEANYRVKQGWFVVFNTLTVRPECEEDVFFKGAKAYKNYCRRLDRKVGIRIFGSWRKAEFYRREGGEFHTHFAVVERGKKTGKLHIHSMHFFRSLPFDSIDPNMGKKYPYYREIQEMKSEKIWPYGHSTPIAVRFHSGDAFGSIGWRWPVERNQQGVYVPLKSNPVDAVICYVGKYLEKEYKQRKEDEIRWRTKISRSLGLTPIKTLVRELNPKQMELLMRISITRYKLRKYPIPTMLTRRLMQKKILKSLYQRSPQFLVAYFKSVKPRKTIFKVLQDVMESSEILKLMNSGKGNLIQNLLLTEDSNIRKILNKIEKRFFPSGDNLKMYQYPGDYYG